MKFTVLLFSLFLAHSAMGVCKNFSGKEKRECDQSKREESKCKTVIKKGITEILGETVAKKDAGKISSSCLRELKEFCDNHAFYKGCKIDAGRKTCTVWKMNKTRTDDEGKKVFPKDMDCMDKYKKYL